jgi:hypothetical protein
MTTELPSCYGDPMPEMEPTVFVSFMSPPQASETVAKVVATICIIAMVVSVWPGSDE